MFWIIDSALEHVMQLILCSCFLSVFINRVNITKPERFCTMYEKCKFLSMVYISVLTQAKKQECSYDFKAIAKDTCPIYLIHISYTIRDGLGGKICL